MSDLYFITAVLLLFGFLPWLYRRAITGDRDIRMVLCRTGVHLLRREGVHEIISWRRFEEAKMSWVTGSVKLNDADGKVVHKISINELRRVRHARKCAVEIMRLKKLYATGEDGSDA